jgi:MATE family multidrug resistance protein
MAYGIDGFAFASESLVGKYIGAADKGGLQKSIKYSFVWGGGLALLFSVFYFLFDEVIISLFTKDKQVISYALSLIFWTVFAPVINTPGYIWDGIYIGATATNTMRNTMIFCALVLFVPIFYFTEPLWGNNALWFALTVFMLARGISLTIFAGRSIYKLI